MHDLFDVSVLFDSADQARQTWRSVFQTDELAQNISAGNLIGLASLGDKQMSREGLDLRLVGEDFPLGAAYIGMKLGVTDAFSLRHMRTDPETGVNHHADQWGPDGRMFQATSLVRALLSRGGHAVVLHKAAAVVKPAGMFDYQAGNLTPDQGERPYLAWLDLMASRGGEGQPPEVRSYGMPHYFGEANVRVRLPSEDRYAVERAMQAVRWACGRMAAANESSRQLASFSVPYWYVAGREIPAGSGTALEWHGRRADDGLMLDIRSRELETGLPANRFANGETLDFDQYSRAVADLHLERASAWRMSEVDAIRYDIEPPVRLMVYDDPHFQFVATAGFGRVASPRGTHQAGTAHAEFCGFGPHDSRVGSVVLNLGSAAFGTPAEGGMQDWESIPPQDGFGFLFVPMSDIPLGTRERPLALRMVVPLDEQMYAEMRASGDRQAWYRATLPSFPDVAQLWSRMLASL